MISTSREPQSPAASLPATGTAGTSLLFTHYNREWRRRERLSIRKRVPERLAGKSLSQAWADVRRWERNGRRLRLASRIIRTTGMAGNEFKATFPACLVGFWLLMEARQARRILKMMRRVRGCGEGLATLADYGIKNVPKEFWPLLPDNPERN